MSASTVAAMRQVWISKVGAPEVLQVREAPDPLPTPREVRIRVKAAGINFADIMARLGIYPDAPKLPAVVGYEVSGVIDAVGSDAKRFAKGDRVMAMTRFGGYSDTLCVPEESIFPIPESMSFEDAASIPVNYLTAYMSLIVMGSLTEECRVLVHSAGGGVGLAALDLCRMVGAQAIGVASAGKHERLKERGYFAAIDGRTTDFEKETLRLTNGRGVDIVLDPVGGESWSKSMNALAPTGRLVIFGFSGAASGPTRSLASVAKGLVTVPWLKMSPMSLISQNKAVVGVNLGHMWSEQARVRRWSEQLLEWYSDGKIRAHFDRSFPFEEAAAAHQYIQDRKNFGKVLLVP